MLLKLSPQYTCGLRYYQAQPVFWVPAGVSALDTISFIWKEELSLL